MQDGTCAVVIDNGSSNIKAGFAGDGAPRTVFPPIIGRPRNQVPTNPAHESDTYIGAEARAKRGILTLNYAVKFGEINDWDAITTLWQHIHTSELSVQPDAQPVLMTEGAYPWKQSREKTTQIVFETLRAPAFYAANSAALALYAAGRATGMVVESGGQVTQSMGVHEGLVMRDTVYKSSYAGDDFTEYLARLLYWRDDVEWLAADMELLRLVKEKLCYVAEEASLETEKFLGEKERGVERGRGIEREYELPDGRVITVGLERFGVPETLFDACRLGLSEGALHVKLYNSIHACSADPRGDMARNIVLAGGNTMFPGFADRLQAIMARDLKDRSARVIAPADRTYSAWVGGSILSSLSTFRTKWISKQDYEEAGPSIVHRKCAWADTGE
ncbi:Actin/actin-like protein [Karstenula rhodostoma CBS 690.94]|uniref:Actin/actin-like protein n=1 Tax=Karstenula rhodostoma CBS 690.94 TaxID=1392251 RepID=A0A9P4PTU9_9PLEO|nr:Actin/actin-like protein [Karstenula rhodostoma CBS 690.94]